MHPLFASIAAGPSLGLLGLLCALVVGMALTPTQYAAFITTVDTTIGQIYTQMDPASVYKEYATTVPITGSIWNAGWTGRISLSFA